MATKSVEKLEGEFEQFRGTVEERLSNLGGMRGQVASMKEWMNDRFAKLEGMIKNMIEMQTKGGPAAMPDDPKGKGARPEEVESIYYQEPPPRGREGLGFGSQERGAATTHFEHEQGREAVPPRLMSGSQRICRGVVLTAKEGWNKDEFSTEVQTDEGKKERSFDRDQTSGWNKANNAEVGKDIFSDSWDKAKSSERHDCGQESQQEWKAGGNWYKDQHDPNFGKSKDSNSDSDSEIYTWKFEKIAWKVVLQGDKSSSTFAVPPNLTEDKGIIGEHEDEDKKMKMKCPYLNLEDKVSFKGGVLLGTLFLDRPSQSR